jgi:hypothetical protein
MAVVCRHLVAHGELEGFMPPARLVGYVSERLHGLVDWIAASHFRDARRGSRIERHGEV